MFDSHLSAVRRIVWAISAVGSGMAVRAWGACESAVRLTRMIAQTARYGLSSPAFDVVIVLPKFARGWIFDRICSEVRAYFPGTSILCDDLSRVPLGRSYFFPHDAFFGTAVAACPWVDAASCVVMYTHPQPVESALANGLSHSGPFGLADLGGEGLIRLLNRAGRVVTLCSLFERALADHGVHHGCVATALMGADGNFFRPHPRGGGVVGLCSLYQPRKAPGRVLEVVKRMPHRRFLLMGRKWAEYPRFAELKQLTNFEYREADYSTYPDFYAGVDVFLSPSLLEGGPMPLLEAMMSNAVPVASRTGFAEDLIVDRKTGFLFDTHAPAEEVCELIESAYALTTDVRATVAHLTWQRFAQQIAGYLTETRR